eukprot:TRINITY_DN10311_c0_g4_i1.p1 TRINITY_DN10311_c0_g4~~TRINITY_DN10311_c0_g4_i1.p1  ORF type:complete len:194 (+),score=29.40 TRINITY_DN10311_c0_g4_i1:498-1079(+)
MAARPSPRDHRDLWENSAAGAERAAPLTTRPSPRDFDAVARPQTRDETRLYSSMDDRDRRPQTRDEARRPRSVRGAAGACDEAFPSRPRTSSQRDATAPVAELPLATPRRQDRRGQDVLVRRHRKSSKRRVSAFADAAVPAEGGALAPAPLSARDDGGGVSGARGAASAERTALATSRSAASSSDSVESIELT